ncbi:SCO family protein [Pinibacter soli]|uniref:SCO family protein n=1 Tax=Pinibacter soli TaxID=3044211 RepID=A0ABT6R914_9BACT|nr:SCO family protein [Pinibacter soli]MDI3318900.1 SCO family protein [Pinibacter soli]
MKKKILIYSLFFILLFVGFVFALTRFIPGFGEVKLPVLSYVQPFSFTNQDGKVITQQNVMGKVYVAEYFFTTCKSICPKMNTNMKDVYNTLKNEPDFLILSHTVDPETDTVGRMKVYADSLGANPSKWLFLTGAKDSLYYAARVSYLLDDPKNNNQNIADQFIHTQFFALVDKSGRVRKIYDGLKKNELSEMEQDVKNLLKESDGGRFANGLFNNNPG